jgi:hypothetical protein
VTEPRFEAALDLVITPPDGARPVIGRVHGEGATLVVTTAQPQRLVEELRFAGATDVRGLGDAAGFLAGRSAAIRIDGPHGTVLRIGAEAGSPFGRLLTGSRDVGIGSARAIAPLARGAARDVARRPTARTSIAFAIVIVLLEVARRALRSRSQRIRQRGLSTAPRGRS